MVDFQILPRPKGLRENLFLRPMHIPRPRHSLTRSLFILLIIKALTRIEFVALAACLQKLRGYMCNECRTYTHAMPMSEMRISASTARSR
jgi:hypothetical protein